MTRPDAPPDDLDSYRWRRRLLLLFAPDRDHPELRRQRELLAGRDDDLEERDLTVLERLGTQGTEAGSGLRERYEVAPDAFALLLIGKDGGCKRRESVATDPETLFAQIDAMPMRVREMREAEA